MAKLLIGLGVIFVILSAYFYAIVSWGIVIYCTYEWFIQSVFTQLPAISYVQAMGLYVFISLFHATDYHTKNYNTNESVMIIFHPWIVLGFTYMLKLVIL